MSTYNRKGLAHSRKILTSSLGATRPPRYSVETAHQTSLQETVHHLEFDQPELSKSPMNISQILFQRRRFNENIPTSRASSVFTIREQNFRVYSPWAQEKRRNIFDAREIPPIFVSISKPSPSIAALIEKRKTDHNQAVNHMGEELETIQAACENEFENRSTSVEIQINGGRRAIHEIRDEFRVLNISDFEFVGDSKIAWIKVSALINTEKQFIDNFYNNLLIIEKKRLQNVKTVLKKYYKIFHDISHLMPYEIQVYLENKILKYNEIILANHRVYADLRLQMCLLADFEMIKFKYGIED